MSLEKQIINIAKKAKAAAFPMAVISTAEKNKALKLMAKALVDNQAYLIKENKRDLLAGQKSGLSKALMDRLLLNEARIKGMADCLKDTAKLKDPVGEHLEQYKRPNGLVIDKVRTPLGVVGIIYESRPNVTSDCVGLTLKSGNACILKGGKESIHSNKAIFKVLKGVLAKTKIPVDAINLIESIDRQAVTILLKLNEYVDLIVPRGGEGLIKFVAANSLIPVVKHDKGLCHTYVSEQANLDMAQSIAINAKVQRPGVCNAMETLLVHKKIAKKFLPSLCDVLEGLGVEIRGCDQTCTIVKGIKRATKADWDTEYLDLVLSIKVVNSLKEAIDHINEHGSQHSDAIVTKSKVEANEFFKSVDSACLYHNASTRFTDGYEFGFGAEVGISTDKIHARGPMALEGLTTYKYVIKGEGQIK